MDEILTDNNPERSRAKNKIYAAIHWQRRFAVGYLEHSVGKMLNIAKSLKSYTSAESFEASTGIVKLIMPNAMLFLKHLIYIFS